jgi:uncharacterized sodium:solute symporter family permease YidK
MPLSSVSPFPSPLFCQPVILCRFLSSWWQRVGLRFLEERFGRWARIYASACYLAHQIARMGSILYLLAVPMYISWDGTFIWFIIATSIAIVIYSMLGGIKSCHLD